MRIKILTAFIFFISVYTLKAQNDSSNVSKLLSLSLEELMNIKVVTASGYLQTTAEAPSTITVITAQQISDRGYEQLEDALRDIPGIDMIHINGYAPTLIYFRGMYGAENLRALLMIDGIVENNILGSNDIAGPAYNLHNALRIEIIWGPVSALYGANAFGGVINIITKKGADVNGLHVEKGFGTFNTSFENVNVGIKKSKFEFNAAGTLYSSDGPKFSNRDPNYSGSYFSNAYSFNSSLSYSANKTKTTIGYRTYNTPMGWGTYGNSPTTYLGLPAQGYNNQGVLGILQSDIRGERSGLDAPFLRTAFIENEYKPNEKLNFTGRFVYRETGIRDDSYIYITTDGKRLIWLPITSFSNRFTGELFANYAPSKNHRFSAGFQYNRDNVETGARKTTFDPTTLYIVDGRDTVLNLHATFLKRTYDIRKNYGGFLQYILNTTLLGKTSFTFGGRYDHNSYFGNALSPRVGIVNQPDKKLSLKFQFGQAFRAPTNLEIYQTPASATFQLEKEKITTFEINGIYSASDNVSVQLNGFSNKLTDVIILGNLPGLNPDKNPGVFNINGVEGILNLSISKNIFGFINFTYQDAKGENLITHNKGKLPGVAKFKGNAGITMHADDLFTVTLSGNYVGKRQSPRTDPYGPVQGYFLTNFAIKTTELFNARVTVSFVVHNVLNIKWLDPGFRTADGLLYSTVLEQPGINGLFKIGITL